MRTFIAIDIEPSETLSSFYRFVRECFQDYRVTWVNPAKFHLTLAFLGDIDENQYRCLANRLHKVSLQHSPFEFSLVGFGFFGSDVNPNVLWIGIENVPELKALQAGVAVAVRECGIYLEERPFRPHLTLGRVKESLGHYGLKRLAEEYSGTKFQQVEADRLILYQSDLQRTGPVYTVLKQYPLGAG